MKSDVPPLAPSQSRLPHDLVRTLLAVVDEGTFDAAAAALHLTPSAVSQRIKALEQRTGRVLLTRTKPVRVTESGQVVVRFGRQLAQLEGDARSALGLDTGDAPPRLAIAVNADSLATWFVPALGRLDQTPGEPGVTFDVRREDEAHTTALLRDGEVMAAVTSTPEPVAGCSVRALGRMRYLPVATAEFVDTWLRGDPAELLPRAPVVFFDRRDQLQEAFARELTGGMAGADGPRHWIPSSDGYAEAVCTGLGWGLLPEAQAQPRLRDGTLRRIVPGLSRDVPLFWQQWRLDSPALAVVAEAVAAEAAEQLHR
ncbi:LysR family transcriptional regulator ArgP [Streptacidiphilus fuscans]|uniref:HTH-type transcriptional regulator LysG n=1 Tax=Streptacidiphilus fuscans TaxID=2789292 RepID=A0A931FEI9_9ACTN|nr:LysR family transcriptional regulator ArgP [Streptacidiphilus fuscans]MBF9068691.1 LysR family transcriptional regulator ArgP [Streptacidiphilus fuscans]